MSALSYYPEGAYDDPSAPYNEDIKEKRNFDVEINCNLSVKTTITSDEYDTYGEYNGESKLAEFVKQYYTIHELLIEYRDVLYRELEELKDVKSVKKSSIKTKLDSIKLWLNAEEELEEL